MGKLRLKYSQKNSSEFEEYKISKRELRKFNLSILGIDDLAQKGETLEALSVIFDLQQFTTFCDQRDPQLEVPKYLSKFFDWLFKSLVIESKNKEDKNHIKLWHPLPFFAKFLGDGVLLLWDMTSVNQICLGNIITSLYIICDNYKREFLLTIHQNFLNPPPTLRCGISIGQVTSIGAESDFIGLCINTASRLQKLNNGKFSFAFSKKGLNSDEWLKEDFITIKIPIRGFYKKEFVCVLKKEFKKLSKKEQKKYSVNI